MNDKQNTSISWLSRPRNYQVTRLPGDPPRGRDHPPRVDERHTREMEATLSKRHRQFAVTRQQCSSHRFAVDCVGQLDTVRLLQLVETPSAIGCMVASYVDRDG